MLHDFLVIVATFDSQLEHISNLQERKGAMLSKLRNFLGPQVHNICVCEFPIVVLIGVTIFFLNMTKTILYHNLLRVILDIFTYDIA